MPNAINWFDVPATDFARAKTFYETIFAMEMTPMPGMDNYVFFPAQDGVGGGMGLMESPKPGDNGPLIYLNGGDNLQVVLDRVEAAGGKVVMPKTGIGEDGFIGRFTDTEGNLVGIHSQN